MVTLLSLKIKTTQELKLVLGTGISATAAPQIPGLTSWKRLRPYRMLPLILIFQMMQRAKNVRNVSVKTRILFLLSMTLFRDSPCPSTRRVTFFKNCLYEVLLKSKMEDSGKQVLRSLLHLMKNGAPVVTTNFDNLLKLYAAGQKKQLESLELNNKEGPRVGSGEAGAARVKG